MFAKAVAGFTAALTLAVSTASADPKRNCLSWPVPGPQSVLSGFHDPKHPFRNPKKGRNFYEHDGVDILAPQGTPIFAPAGGEVAWTGPDEVGAAYIAIIMPSGRVYELYHLSVIAVGAGQKIRRGQFLGRTGGAIGGPGSGPYTTGPHLHLSLLDKGHRHVDPQPRFCKRPPE